MPADQHACTERVLEAVPDAAVVANLGVASWVLAEVEDRDRNFYMRGAMGGTTPTGLGLSLATDDPVVVLDGDGSLLMSLGTLAVVAEYGPPTLTIVVWDNRSYQTTGGQPVVSTDFAAVAEACGIRGFSVDSDAAFADAFADAIEHDGPALVSCRVDAVDVSAPPSYDYRHGSLTQRFRAALTR